jgi:valyl-tRNA synthetase
LYDIEEFLERRDMTDLRLLEMKSKPETPQVTEVPAEVAPAPKNEGGRERRDLQRRIQNLEKGIEKLEVQKAQIEGEMAQTDFYFREDAKVITDTYQKICQEMEQKTSAWESVMTLWEGKG